MKVGARTEQANARKRAFLDSFRLSGNVSAAARAVKVERHRPYVWAADDAAFKAAWAEAEQESIDRLEKEARRRAEDGCLEPVYQGGKLVGHKQVYSDALMMLLLKAHRPEKYRERSALEVTGAAGGPVKVSPEVTTEFFAEALRLLGEAEARTAPEGSEESVQP